MKSSLICVDTTYGPPAPARHSVEYSSSAEKGSIGTAIDHVPARGAGTSRVKKTISPGLGLMSCDGKVMAIIRADRKAVSRN